MTTDLLYAALAYTQRGVPVFPLEANGKRPLTIRGFHDATTDPTTVARWWQRSPHANIGMPTGCGTADILDVDNKPAGDGWDAFRRLVAAGLLRGAHRTVRTPSGGAHVYFRPSGNTNHTLASHHLDVRGDGGYVVVPPSIIDGNPYELIDERDADGTLDWAACRTLLAPAVSPAPRPRFGTGHDGVGSLVNWCANLTEGNRNAGLFWACCRALETGHDDLHDLVDAVVLVGLPQAEADRTAASARRRIGAAA